METIEEIKITSSDNLLEYISWKDDYPEEAKQAFREFCFRFDQFVKERAEIACSKWNYDESVALEIVECTLARVWKYPTYKHSKSNAKDVDKGIKLWLGKISYTQLANYHNKNTCYEPDKETDLNLIYTVENLAEKITQGGDSTILFEKIAFLEEALSKLSRKHRIIYYTYYLYENTHSGKNIPRTVTKKLRDELELTQGSIRKYKEDAKKEVKKYLNQ